MKWLGPSGRVVWSGGAALAVHEAGDSATPLIFVHGLGDSHHSWVRVIQRIGGRFRSVSYDLRGHGGSSDAEPYDIAALVADLGAVVDALSLGSPLLVGHSLGGLVAVEYAAAHPCAGVISVEGGLAVDRPPVTWDDIAMRMARPLNRLLARGLAVSGVGSRLTLNQLRQIAEDAERCERGLDDTYLRVGCRMLFVLGSKPDPIPNGLSMRAAIRDAAQRLQRTHPDVEVAWLDCGHMAPLERPRELAALIVRFAARVAEATGK